MINIAIRPAVDQDVLAIESHSALIHAGWLNEILGTVGIRILKP